MQDVLNEFYLIKKTLESRQLIPILSILSKMVIDTMLKFSTYTNILMGYRMIYHTLL